MNTETVSGTQMTFAEYMPEIYQKLIVGASDSLVKTSQLADSTEDFKVAVHRYSSELCTFVDNAHPKTDPTPYSLRMLKICCLLIEDGISPNFSLKWTRQGTMQNGVFSTPKTSEYHRTENDVSLLDILEKDVAEKYFLSHKGGVHVSDPTRLKKKHTKLHYV